MHIGQLLDAAERLPYRTATKSTLISIPCKKG